jgi:hypothetical protein
MNAHHFDGWLLSLGDNLSRRRLGRLGAASFTVVVGGFATAAEARSKRKKRKKRKPKNNEAPPACPAGESTCQGVFPTSCGGGACYCAAGTSGTICSDWDNSACSGTEDLCQVDADCDTVTGPGSVCILLDNDCFCGSSDKKGFKACFPPCGAS